MSKLKVLELFGGVGTFSMALRRLAVPYEVVDYVDIDKYATQAFNAIHTHTHTPQDICEWDKDIEVDMVCHGSPCTSFSVAGKGLGGDKGSGTASSLMWETVRILEKLKPKYVIWENVKNLLSKKHRHNFDAYIETLDNLGYNSYYQVLNAKEYGIPQNRERVFTVSIRKDVDDGKFEFPETILLEKKLKDVLEKEVDEKYYLSEERVASIKFSGKIDSNVVGKCEAINGHDILKRIYNTETVAPTLHTMGGGNTEPKIIDPQGRKNKVNTPKEVAPTLRAQDHGNPPMAIVDDTYANRDARVYESSAPTLRSERSGLKVVVEPFIVASRGRNPDNPSDRTTGAPTEQRLEAHTDGVSNTLTSVVKDNYVGQFLPIKNATKKGYLEGRPYDGVYTQTGNKRGTVQSETAQTLTTREDKGVVLPGLRVRKLTPLECWRLQGYDDEDFYKAQNAGISNSQLYKMAGNGICRACPIAIFSQLLCERKWNDMTNEERQALVKPSQVDKKA